jgi:hypothetical protein
MRTIRHLAVAALLAAGITAAGATTAHAGAPFFWELEPTTFDCFTSQGNQPGFAIQGTVTSSLPPAPAVATAAWSVNGGGESAIDPTLASFSAGSSASLPFTGTTILFTLRVDGVAVSQQTIVVDCTQPAPPPGGSYPGAIASDNLVLLGGAPADPEDGGGSGRGGGTGLTGVEAGVTPVADVVSAQPRVTG